MSTRSYHDVQDDNLIKIEQNKVCAPEHKKILLTREPYVDVVPYGRYVGCYAVVLDVSYSPLKTYPLSDVESRVDKLIHIYSAEELIKKMLKKQPSYLLIKGGEPFFKWDEDLYYVAERCSYKDILVDTSGIIIPQRASGIHNFRVHINIFGDEVPESEFFYYKKTLIENVKQLLKEDDELFYVDLICIFKESESLEEQMENYIDFLQQVHERQDRLNFNMRVTLTMQDEASPDSFLKLKNVFSKYLLNIPRASVEVNLKNI